MNFDSIKHDLHSTVFWATLFTIAGTWLATLVTNLPSQWGVYATVAASAAYAISKGIQKNSTDLAHGWETSEFYVGVIAVAITGFAAIQNTIPSKFAVIGTILNLVAFTLSQGIAKPNPAALAEARAVGLTALDTPLPDGDNRTVPAGPVTK